jgi:hypothetical protein
MTPSAADLRAVIDAHVARYGRTLYGGSEDFYQPFDAVGAFWSDLRTAETARLEAIMEAAEARAKQRCQAILIEEAIAAGLAFAAGHQVAEAIPPDEHERGALAALRVLRRAGFFA